MLTMMKHWNPIKVFMKYVPGRAGSSETLPNDHSVEVALQESTLGPAVLDFQGDHGPLTGTVTVSELHPLLRGSSHSSDMADFGTPKDHSSDGSPTESSGPSVEQHEASQSRRPVASARQGPDDS